MHNLVLCHFLAPQRLIVFEYWDRISSDSLPCSQGSKRYWVGIPWDELLAELLDFLNTFTYTEPWLSHFNNLIIVIFRKCKKSMSTTYSKFVVPPDIPGRRCKGGGKEEGADGERGGVQEATALGPSWGAHSREGGVKGRRGVYSPLVGHYNLNLVVWSYIC